MEALRFSPTQPPLLRRHAFDKMARNPVNANTRNCRPKPFIAATLSKPAEIASSSAVEDPSLSVSPPRPRVSPDSLQYPLGYVGPVPDRSHSDGNDGVVNAMGYLTNILSSKVYDVAIESPLQIAPMLSERLGVKL